MIEITGICELDQRAKSQFPFGEKREFRVETLDVDYLLVKANRDWTI